MRNRSLLVVVAFLALAGCGAPPPQTPGEPGGPSFGLVGEPCRFRAVTTDPLGLPLQYRFDWGDGAVSDWSECVASGTPVTAAHAWRTAGIFAVTAQGRNAAGRTSGFSAPHLVDIGRTGGRFPDSVLATIAVGGDPTDIAVLPGGEFIYIGNEIEDYVTVVNTADRSVETTVECGSSPWMLARSPDGRRVYVTSQWDGSLSVIRTSDNIVVATVAGVGSSPARCCVAPDNSRCYVADQNGSRVTVVRTSDNTIEARVAVGPTPRDVDVTPDGAFAYSANLYATTLTCIRTADLVVVATIDIGFRPHRVRCLPGGEYAVAAEYYGARLAVVRVNDNTVVRTINLGAAVAGMTTANDGDYLYVATDDEGVGAAAIVRTSDWALVGFVPVGGRPLSVHSPEDGSFVASCDRLPRTVTLIGRRSLVE